jgi:hypothetical protein
VAEGVVRGVTASVLLRWQRQRGRRPSGGKALPPDSLLLVAACAGEPRRAAAAAGHLTVLLAINSNFVDLSVNN